MKMVKSLLLGSAAGLFAVAGAQAADLPVKAKAVEYVKICSLYGVGYYYIPGTDTCIKIGGYVRWEGYHNAAAGAYPNYTAEGQFTRHSNDFAMQARFRLTADVRTQTEYGTLRSYFSMGLNWLNQPNEPFDIAARAPGGGIGFTGNFGMALERAFIQFAGFTIGRADSMFAFYNGAAYGLVPMQMDGSSGPAGLNIFAYTWQFGNGLSATLSAEDAFARSAGVLDVSNAGFPGPGAGPSLDTKGQTVPDIVGNLRVDQGWGSAQIMGSLHQVGGRYWTNDFLNPATCSQGNTTGCGHPGDQWGWAVGAGLTLKMPWDAKDTLSGVIAYSEGHARAVTFGMPSNFVHRQDLAVGIMSDGIYRSPGILAGYDGSIELTTVWGGTVAFEHYWTPALRTSWVFGYIKTEYSDTAKQLILAGGAPGTKACQSTTVVVPNSQCDPDWAVWRLASRTMWNPVANLDVGLEVAYTKVDTAFAGATGFPGSSAQGLANNAASGPYLVDDQSFWSATLRVQRSFWP
jgi:hypothetical protein